MDVCFVNSDDLDLVVILLESKCLLFRNVWYIRYIHVNDFSNGSKTFFSDYNYVQPPGCCYFSSLDRNLFSTVCFSLSFRFSPVELWGIRQAFNLSFICLDTLFIHLQSRSRCFMVLQCYFLFHNFLCT